MMGGGYGEREALAFLVVMIVLAAAVCGLFLVCVYVVTEVL